MNNNHAASNMHMYIHMFIFDLSFASDILNSFHDTIIALHYHEV